MYAENIITNEHIPSIPFELSAAASTSAVEKGSVFFFAIKNELIAYGYIDRTDIGGIYWVKDYDRVDYPEVVAK